MRSILVALDGSPNAKVVLDAAVDLAQRVGAKLRLLRAVALPPELPASIWAVPQTEVLDSFLMAARRELEDLAGEAPSSLIEDATAQVGVAWDAICAAAREQDVDLIVVGSHAQKLLGRLLGSTASKVVNHADRSVLVVRTDAP